MPFEFFPNTNFHDMNLDYILEKTQKIDDNMRDSQASADAAKASEEAAKASEDAAKLSEENAKASEEAAKASEDAAKDYAANIADPVSGIVTGWLAEHITQETGYALDASLTSAAAAAPAKTVGDIALHFITMTQDNAANIYGGLLANTPVNTYFWGSLSWFSDSPSEATATVGMFMILASATNAIVRNEIFIDGTNGDIWIRRKYSSGYFSWTQIFRLDSTLTLENAAAPAKTVGDKCLAFLTVKESDASNIYDGLIANIPINRFAWIRPSWFNDGPNTTTLGFIITIGIAAGVRSELFVGTSTNEFWTRQRYSSGYSTWKRNPQINHNTGAGYYAFGDSTTNGQIGDFDNPGRASAHPYPKAVADHLQMVLHNVAVRGQGLIDDYDNIISTINNMTMNDARLITVGWAYNDINNYHNYPMGDAHASDISTVIGHYHEVMRTLQDKCPNAQIVLVTGYGYPGGNASQQTPASLTAQFTHEYIFQDGGHTVKEFYDTLEAMCWENGWCCVNQAKGCAFNRYNVTTMIGDQIHPTETGYIAYSNNLAPRIANYYLNMAE